MIALEKERIRWKEIPPYFRKLSPCHTGSTYIRCLSVKIGGNEPNCYTEEKLCAGHICRVLSPERTVDRALVIRDDGTVWSVQLSAFAEITLLEVEN